VYTAKDLPFGETDLPILIPHPNLTHGRTQRCLASEVVRYAGEAVAFVVAESRAIAEDAAELVDVDYEPLPVVITPEAAARAVHLGRPVKWTEDRQEHFTAVNQERGQVHEVEVGYDDEGHVLALDDDFIHDGGAYTPYGIILPIITAGQVPGPYRVPNYRVRFRDMYTNATPTSPYRGAGRPHACFVMKRPLDALAAQLGIDRAEVRRRNLIQPDEFPYDVGVGWQDGNTVVYDSGNYPKLLETALEKLGSKPAGENVGMGLGMYVEGTGVGPYEGAHVQVLVSGKVVAATGIPSQGRAHATVWAPVAAGE